MAKPALKVSLSRFMAAPGPSRMQTLAELLSHPLLDQAVYSQYAHRHLKNIAASGTIATLCKSAGEALGVYDL